MLADDTVIYEDSGEEHDECTPLVAAQFVAKAEKEVQAGFIKKVYAIFSLQLLLTVLIAIPLQYLNRTMLHTHIWVCGVSSGVLLLTVGGDWFMCETMKKYPHNYLCLLSLTLGMGVTLGYLVSWFTLRSVLLACFVVVVNFACMSLYAGLATPDFEDAGPNLMSMLLTVVLCTLAFVVLSWFGFTPTCLQFLEVTFCILLFGFFIVYDSQRILIGDHRVQFLVDDFAYASICLYLDVVNLFIALLMVLGMRDSKVAKSVATIR